jgi:protein ImuB
MATKTILLECAGAFSPRVEERSQDTAFLCGIDISGTQSLFGPPEMLARTLVQRVRAVDITARVTVSNNFQAAVCLARGLSPRGVFRVIPPGEEATALASLPIAVLDPTEIQAETFALWGIRTLGMLADLPEKELIARMGQDGTFTNSDNMVEMIRRGNGFRDLASKQAVEHAIMAGRSNVDLLLTQEQYERLVG